MDVLLLYPLLLSSFSLLLYGVVRVSYSIWWKPKWLERQLKQQGIRCIPYKLLVGDIPELVKQMKAAWSKPINLNHNIVPLPRISSFSLNKAQKYGKISMFWAGKTPRLIIKDPEKMKEVLSNKQGHFGKPPINTLVPILTRGLTTLEGETWNKRRGYSILHSTLRNSRFLPTKKNQKRKKLVKEITSIMKDLIQRKQNAIRSGQSKVDDILSFLQQCTEKNGMTQNTNGPKSADMTIEEVIEECKQFYLAGQETTASLITWTIIILCMHPDWQQRAREEVLQVCGKKDPDFEAISHLKTVTMILNEVLRLYPPAIAIYMHTYKETKIGDISIQAGVDLNLPILLIHHDPELWGDDAEEFKPERFSEGVSNASKDQLAFFPFSWGPKTCIGLNFAMIKAKMTLAMILQHFSFGLSPSYTHAPYTVLTLQPQHGAQIRLRQLRICSIFLISFFFFLFFAI